MIRFKNGLMSYVSSDEVVLDWFRVACAVLERPVEKFSAAGWLACFLRVPAVKTRLKISFRGSLLHDWGAGDWGDRPADICLSIVWWRTRVVLYDVPLPNNGMLHLFSRCSDTSLDVSIALFIHPGNVNGASIETKHQRQWSQFIFSCHGDRYTLSFVLLKTRF